MTGTWITQDDRSGWQLRAAAELARILRAHRQLPCIAWTVGPAGCVLTGHVSGLAPAARVRDTFAAWQAALALGGHREQPAGAGTVHLTAAACCGGVKVRITATVLAGAGEHDGGQVPR